MPCTTKFAPYSITVDRFTSYGQPTASLRVGDDEDVLLSSLIRDITEVDVNNRIGLSSVSWCSIENDGYWIAPGKRSDDVFLLTYSRDDELEVVGEYVGTSMYIHPSHRGLGLSIPLILAAASARRAPPNYSGDFTPLGYAAHLAAHRHAIEWALNAGINVTDEVLESAGLHSLEQNSA